jgi:GAF domain-containing protein
MKVRNPRVVIWSIWGMVAAYAVIQITIWSMTGGIPRRPLVVVQVLGAWFIMLVLAAVTTRLIQGLSRDLSDQRHEHQATIGEVEQLQISNEMLQILSRSVDVPLAFQALARRVVRLVPCERVGLALLSEDGKEFQTYTARVHDEERRTRPRPEIVFKIERTALGTVVRSREPLIINDTREGAQDFLDVNVLHTAGFGSAVLVPLVARGRAVGTINLVTRKRNAFHQHHVDAILPIAEMLAVAHVAQHLQVAVGQYRLMEAMSELTLSIAAEINSALQTIIGHCDLLERGYPDTQLQRDLATVVHQAERISSLLDKMRTAAHERLQQMAESVSQGGIPTSPDDHTETEGQT